MGIQVILALINAALPTIGNLIVAIKNANGTVDVGVLTSQANAADQTYIQTVSAWLAAHPATTPAPTPPVPPAA
jgi:hypothetical protein